MTVTVTLRTVTVTVTNIRAKQLIASQVNRPCFALHPMHRLETDWRNPCKASVALRDRDRDPWHGHGQQGYFAWRLRDPSHGRPKVV